MVNIPQHQPQIAIFGNRLWQSCIQRNPFKMCGKFASAKAGLMKALTLLCAAVENIQMLASVVFWPRLGGHLKMSLDQIGGFDQHGGSALLAVFIWWARSWVLGALWVAGEAAIWASWPAWAAPVFPPRVAVVCVWVVALVVFYVVRVRKAHSLADTKENLSRAGHHASAR